MARAESILPAGAKIVRENFDIGQSRSLPRKRRPEAAALLQDLRDPSRGFGGVVIGEPARAFYGAQFQNTFPLFTHHGVQLWVPDVGGYVDPESDGAEMMMAIYGTLSTQERRRVKIRGKTAMTEQAKEGRFLGGRPPYGYRLADAGAHPNPGKAADGKRLHQLEIDPAAAPVVQRIFDEYLNGRGLFAIAEGLTDDEIPSPSAHDPARNRHRDGRAWAKSAVKAILQNPRYTGRLVWNRQRRDEILIDVEDVAAGHESKMRWNDPTAWIYSSDQTHEAIISTEGFAAVQRQMAAGAHRPTVRKVRATHQPYVLPGLVRCGCCGRRMQGNAAHGTRRYRCTYPAQYALANRVDHPRTVYVKEDAIVPHLDAWIANLFDEPNLDATCEALAVASVADDGSEARAQAARLKIADCDKRLSNCRRLLDADGDPAVVAAWIAEVQGERQRAERELGGAVPQEQLTVEQVRRLVLSLRDIAKALAKADPNLKAQLYEELGVEVTYDPTRRVIAIGAGPCATERVGGGLPQTPTGDCLPGRCCSASWASTAESGVLIRGFNGDVENPSRSLWGHRFSAGSQPRRSLEHPALGECGE